MHGMNLNHGEGLGPGSERTMGSVEPHPRAPGRGWGDGAGSGQGTAAPFKLPLTRLLIVGAVNPTSVGLQRERVSRT